MSPLTPLHRRVWSRIDTTGEHWLWTGYCRPPQGYGTIWLNGRSEYIHRVVWELQHGPIPSGKQVNHECDIPACVRHLYLGTQKENIRDMDRRGRRPKRHALHKLSVEQVRTIRASRELQRVLAARYGVNQSTICRIRTGRRWRGL